MGPVRAPSTAVDLARAVRPVLGGTSVVDAFGDEREENRVYVVSAVDSPAPGWLTCATVSLHTTPNLLDGKDVRVELMATARVDDAELANLVATVAFFVIKNGWLAAPGVVFPDQVREYFPDATTPHLLWTDPFRHPELGSVEVDGIGPVHYLQAVPLTEPERDVLHEDGYDVLTSRLADADVAYFDLWRPSSVDG